MLMRMGTSSFKIVVMIGLFSAVGMKQLPAHGQSGTPDADRVQRFGPLVVVASHEGVPDPEITARFLLGEDPVEKLKALKAMGVDSDPSVHELWLSLQSKEGISEERLAGEGISTRVPEVIYDPDLEPYKIVSAALEHVEVHDHFFIETILREENSNWYRVATVACLCDGYRNDDLPLRPWLHKQREIGYLITTPREHELGWDLQKFRFRLRNGSLALVLSSEQEHWRCPDGMYSGKLCTGTEVSFQRSRLIDGQGHQHDGFALWTSALTSHMRDMEIPSGPLLNCEPYVWNEEKFAYEISGWKAVSCKGFKPKDVH